jgi:protoheme ferro-lyase
MPVTQKHCQVAIVFSAHSVPMKVVEKGDQYVPEVCATVKAVMARLSERIAAGKVDHTGGKVIFTPPCMCCMENQW